MNNDAITYPPNGSGTLNLLHSKLTGCQDSTFLVNLPNIFLLAASSSVCNFGCEVFALSVVPADVNLKMK